MMLKLDFNERADSTPQWLNEFSVDVSQIWKYPDKQEVEQLIAQKFNTTVENVFLSNGGDESIELLYKMCKLELQSVLLPTPVFSQYTHNLKVWDIENIIVDGLKNLTIDVNGIKKNLQANQWLILTRPNNPTGECLTDEVLIDLINTAKVKGANVFLDEAYIEFYLENNPIEYALEFDNVISLRTFSKAYGLAGARLGYLLGSGKLINKFKQIALPFNVNNLSLQLAKQAIQNTSEMQLYCVKIDENRGEIHTFLQSCNIEICDGKGNFLLFKVSPKIKQLLGSYMQKNGIQIKTKVNDLPDWVRITIPENSELLMEVLQTVFKPEILGFDMDGVLLDTSESYDACIIKTVNYFTNSIVTIVNIIKLRENGGFNNDWDVSQGLIKQIGFNVKFDDIVAKFQQYYNGNEKTKGLKENEISLINKQNISAYFNNSYTTAIITGRPRSEAIEGVEQLNIKVDYIISADDVSEQKPSPLGINWLKSTINKDCMWFCGDTVDDMQAGQASNCVCIGIGENSESLYAAGADIVINNINELEEIL